MRLDAASLRRVGAPVSIGRPIRIGPQAFDVEAEGGVAWVTNAFDGTVTRVNGLTGATTTTRIGGGLLDSAVRAGTLWVPDVVGGTVTPIDGRGMRPRAAPLRGDHPISVTAAGDSLWVLAQTTNIGGGGPMRLYRAAGESPAFVGQPVDVGSDLGWIAADASAVWVRSVARRAVMKYVPTSPPPASRRATPPTAATILRPGALRTGTWTTARFRAPLSFRIDLPGWLVINDGPRGLELGRYDDPRAGITIAVPPQVFDSKGGVHRLRSPRQALDALTLNRHLRLSEPRRSSFGGLAATAVTVRVRRYPKYPEFCHASCVVAFGMPTGGLVLGADIPTRIWLLRQNGQTVVVTATAGGRQAGVATSQLLDSVRFG